MTSWRLFGQSGDITEEQLIKDGFSEKPTPTSFCYRDGSAEHLAGFRRDTQPYKLQHGLMPVF